VEIEGMGERECPDRNREDREGICWAEGRDGKKEQRGERVLGGEDCNKRQS
jgi:hypothetical protein